MEKSEIFILCIKVLTVPHDWNWRYAEQQKFHEEIKIDIDKVDKFGLAYAEQEASKEWLKNNMIFK